MSTPKIQLYGFVTYDRSGKVRWTLEELGLPFESVFLDYGKGEADTQEFLALNPMGAVPVLKFDDIVMHESNAIVTFLADSHPATGLLPDAGTKERALCLQWLHFADGTLGFTKSYRTALVHTADYPADARDAEGKSLQEAYLERRKEADDELELAHAAIEAQLKDREYLTGTFSVADIAVSYGLFWTDIQMGLKSPVLKDYLERCKARPAAIRAKTFDRKPQ